MKYRIFIYEFLATFQFVAIGTGAIVFKEETGQIGDLGVGLAFGVAMYLGITLFSRTNGAHMNPAVSIFAWLIKKITWRTAVLLIIIQMVAAVLASFLVSRFASPGIDIGLTNPNIGVGNTWLFEFAFTFSTLFLLSFLYKKPYIVLAFIFGLVITSTYWYIVPFTGASFNPARSFGPAVITGELQYYWIYLTAPICGAFTAGYLLQYLISRR